MHNGNPLDAAASSRKSEQHVSPSEALRLMRNALKLLDENNAPDDVGAHLDDAINRLEDWLHSEGRS